MEAEVVEIQVTYWVTRVYTPAKFGRAQPLPNDVMPT